jgi:hypothetical protein
VSGFITIAFYKKQYKGNIDKDREIWLGGEFTKNQEDVLKKANE